MKCLCVLILVFTIASGFIVERLETIEDDKVNVQFKENLIEILRPIAEKLASKEPKGLLGDIYSALLNDYVDALLPAVNQAILDAGLDPTTVPDETINFGIGKATLSEGNLTKIATIERYHNVTVSYDTETRKVDIDLILRWADLKMIYKYHSKVVIISSTGHVLTDVEHLKIHIKLGFDFNSKHISVDALDFNHTGDISLTFTGVGILDYIIDAMSATFTTIFHNLILDTIKKIVMDPINEVVDELNTIIDNILNPTTTVAPNLI